jgi:CTP synthase
VCQRLGLVTSEPDLSEWRELVRRVVEPRAAARVAVVGKYTDYIDSYKSVQESLVHGGIAHDVGVDVDWVSSDRFTSAERAREILAGYDGLLVPGGFGVRGVEGMVEAIRTARETGLPFFGICLGMQTAIIEFARNVCGISDSHSSEFAPECANAVVSLMESQQHVTDMGGTMRSARTRAASRRARARGRRTAPTRSASATGTGTRSPTASARRSSVTGSASAGCRPTDRWSRSWSSPTIRGSWAASSTRS